MNRRDLLKAAAGGLPLLFLPSFAKAKVAPKMIAIDTETTGLSGKPIIHLSDAHDDPSRSRWSPEDRVGTVECPTRIAFDDVTFDVSEGKITYRQNVEYVTDRGMLAGINTVGPWHVCVELPRRPDIVSYWQEELKFKPDFEFVFMPNANEVMAFKPCLWECANWNRDQGDLELNFITGEEPVINRIHC